MTLKLPFRTAGAIARVCIALVLTLTATLGVAEPLRVAVSPDYAPLAFKRDGELVGIEIDNATAVGEILGRRVKFVEMDLDQFIPALEVGTVDVVMSGFSITPERKALVAFANPFMEIGQMAIVRTSDVVRFSGPRALYQEGVRIAVEPGTTGETYAREHFQRALIQHFADPDHAFAALRAKVSDVYIHDAPTSWLLAESRENQDLFSLYKSLTTEQLGWAVSLRNQLLREQLNTALDELRNNGFLQLIQNRWIPVKVEVR